MFSFNRKTNSLFDTFIDSNKAVKQSFNRAVADSGQQSGGHVCVEDSTDDDIAHTMHAIHEHSVGIQKCVHQLEQKLKKQKKSFELKVRESEKRLDREVNQERQRQRLESTHMRDNCVFVSKEKPSVSVHYNTALRFIALTYHCLFLTIRGDLMPKKSHSNERRITLHSGERKGDAMIGANKQSLFGFNVSAHNRNHRDSNKISLRVDSKPPEGRGGMRAMFETPFSGHNSCFITPFSTHKSVKHVTNHVTKADKHDKQTFPHSIFNKNPKQSLLFARNVRPTVKVSPMDRQQY